MENIKCIVGIHEYHEDINNQDKTFYDVYKKMICIYCGKAKGVFNNKDDFIVGNKKRKQM